MKHRDLNQGKLTPEKEFEYTTLSELINEEKGNLQNVILKPPWLLSMFSEFPGCKNYQSIVNTNTWKHIRVSHAFVEAKK